MANKMAIALTTDFPATKVKAAINSRGGIMPSCKYAYNLQLIRPQINPAAPINEQPESNSDPSPIIYIV
jgi:hypothetical protein